MARNLVSRQQAIGGRVDPYMSSDNDNVSVPPFGAYPTDVLTTPNDSIVLEVYNYTNDFLEPIYRPSAYTVDGYNVAIDVEKVLEQSRYISGKYNLRARFLRNFLGAADSAKMVITEISSDRLEVRIQPRRDNFADVEGNILDNAFGIDFFALQKSYVLPNLYIYKTIFEAYKVFDYVQDTITTEDFPHSIIFKLTAPLPLSLQVDDLVWVAQEVAAPLTDSITIIPPKPQVSYTYIAPPNYDVLAETMTNGATEYRSWDDVLSTNTDTSLSIIQKLFSGSLVEGVSLNVDYKEFENFVHFGSAEERLRNFKYKLELLEFYDNRIDALSQSYSNTPAYTANSDLTGSQYYVSNVLDAKNKKSAILGGFDGYENYLYYQSSSYESSSFGEFTPTTWPKSNSTRPYVNYSTTSSQAVEWFNGIISSASIYDLNNGASLRKLIPEHVYSDPINDQYILFIDMMGHYFDIIYQYVKQITSVNERYESVTEGFAKDLVYTIGQNLGLTAENGNQFDELWSYVLGANQDSSLLSPTYATSTGDKTKETWKRIITNLPYLLRTKGTARGIRALINCYGIPSTILRVKEYGGPEPEFSTSSQLEYDQFYYGLLVGSGSSQITIPVANYSDSDGETGGYNALELRFRLDTSILTSSLTYDLLSGPITITMNPSIGVMTVGSQTFSASIAEPDTDWWYVLVNAGSKAYVGANRYGKAVIYSSSASPGSITSPSTALIPGSSGGTKFYGLVNEFRLWKNNLDLSSFENHVLAGTSFQGSVPADSIFGSTSSFDELKVRFTLGSDGKKYNLATTTSVTSSHPDQTSLRYTSTAVRGASFSGYTTNSSSYWSPQIETQYLEYVDGGANRNVGNKIRIENAIAADEQLYREGTIQDSVQDLYPIDSARVAVAFSPTDEVNEDISEQFGGLSLDNYIGNPADYYRDEYTGLEGIKNNYFKKYQKRNNVQGFIRLTQNYDSSLFQLIKQFVPERAALQTGLLIESHLLHRNKIKNIKPSHTEEVYTSNTIDIVRDQQAFVQDMDGDERVPGGYVFDTEIDRPYSTLGDTSQFEGTMEPIPMSIPQQLLEETTVLNSPSMLVDFTTPIGYINEYNNDNVLSLNLPGVDLNYDEPSQYQYFTWFQTGSGDNDWRYSSAVGVDIYDPIQPIYWNNRLSDVYETRLDRFRNVFRSNNLRRLSGSVYQSELLRNLGFSSDAQVVSVGTNRYGVQTTQQSVSPTATYNLNISKCFTQPSQSLYRIRGKIIVGDSAAFQSARIQQFGTTAINLTPILPLQGTEIGFDFRAIIVPNYTTLRFNTVYDSTSTGGRQLTLQYLRVERITKAQVQDSDMRWAGRRTSYYEGTKMTSADFNINSPDTIDGGPVVKVNTVNPLYVSATPLPLNPSRL